MFYILNLETNQEGKFRVGAVQNVSGLEDARRYLDFLSECSPSSFQGHTIFTPPSKLTCRTASVASQSLESFGAEITSVIVGDEGHILVQASRRPYSIDISLHDEVDTVLLCCYKGINLVTAAEVSRPMIVPAVQCLLSGEFDDD